MKRPRSTTWLAAIALGVTGCLPVPRGPNPLEMRFMTPGDLREYSEHVFRHQNKVITRMMMAGFEIDGLTETQRQQIERAESELNESCDSINEIANARVQQEQTGLLLRGEVWLSVRGCEQRTDQLESLLNKYGIPG